MAIGKVIKSDASASPEQHRPRGVMNAEEVEARGLARQIVSDADAKAQAIIAEAHRTAAKAKEKAEAEGREKGMAQVTEELARAKMQAGEMLKQAQTDIVALALIVAEKIIGQDLQRDQTTLLQICATAVENMRNARQMTLRVNPQNAAFLRANAKGLMELIGRAVDISIKDDNEISDGGCVVQTEFGTIDAQLPTQLAMLKEVLLTDNAKKEGPA